VKTIEKVSLSENNLFFVSICTNFVKELLGFAGLIRGNDNIPSTQEIKQRFDLSNR
jgi:hypothetical protein